MRTARRASDANSHRPFGNDDTDDDIDTHNPSATNGAHRPAVVQRSSNAKGSDVTTAEDLEVVTLMTGEVYLSGISFRPE